MDRSLVAGNIRIQQLCSRRLYAYYAVKGGVMNKFMFSMCCVLYLSFAHAAPIIDQADVTMTQDHGRQVIITYTLKGDPGIVTVDIQTNTMADASGGWVSIGVENQFGFKGAVNKIVTDIDKPSVITWRANEYWPGHKLRGSIVRAEVKAWATNNPPDVVVFDLANGNTSFYVSLDALPRDVPTDEYKVRKLVLKRCHAAGVPFMMGAPSKEVGRASDNDYHYEDARIGTISADYYLGIYELTEGQYQYIKGKTPERSNASCKPHIGESWDKLRGSGSGQYSWPANGHAVDSSSVMGLLRDIVKHDVDLPTSAQWEFACRAGTASAFPNGAQSCWSDMAAQCAWTKTNSGQTPREVGTIYTNSWGFCDMNGNASEWVLDFISNFPQNHDFENGPSESPCDHQYMLTKNMRMIRGGGCLQPETKVRSACISDWAPSSGTSDNSGQIGCRVCMPAVVRVQQKGDE
jgi:formylglycine-generating enzyme required for sulfatase activity